MWLLDVSTWMPGGLPLTLALVSHPLACLESPFSVCKRVMEGSRGLADGHCSGARWGAALLGLHTPWIPMPRGRFHATTNHRIKLGFKNLELYTGNFWCIFLHDSLLSKPKPGWTSPCRPVQEDARELCRWQEIPEVSG